MALSWEITELESKDTISIGIGTSIKKLIAIICFLNSKESSPTSKEKEKKMQKKSKFTSIFTDIPHNRMSLPMDHPSPKTHNNITSAKYYHFSSTNAIPTFPSNNAVTHYSLSKKIVPVQYFSTNLASPTAIPSKARSAYTAEKESTKMIC